MEKRRSKRKRVHIEAEIISGQDNCPGMIENISEHGLCIETDSEDILGVKDRFHPGTDFEIRFRAPSGDEIKINCRVVWSFRAAPQGLRKKIGMEIIFPPPSYIDFLRASDKDNSA